MKRYLAIPLLIVAAFGFYGEAKAQDTALSLTYFDLHYQNIDNIADGYGVGGSYGFGESNGYVFGDYTSSEFDEINADFTTWHVGFGYSLPLGDPLDMVVEAAYQMVDSDFGDLDGFRLGLGLRGWIGSPAVEGHAKALYYDGGDLEEQWAANLGLNIFLTRAHRFSIFGEYEFADGGDDLWRLGFRTTF